MREIFPILSIALMTLALGCGKTSDKTISRVERDGPRSIAHSDHDGHDHGGWWCPEHGVPEEVCALCNSRVAAEFQREGDWCEDHDRPDSQCFVCHPEAEARFAAQYEAKYGKKPPKPAS